MADNKIQLPSGMGGLVRYSETTDTKFHIKPGTVIIFVILIIVIEILLHVYGKGLLG